MFNLALCLDVATLLVVIVAVVYAHKIFRKARSSQAVWMILATVYFAFLRVAIILRDLEVIEYVSMRAWSIGGYILLLIGLYGIYRTLKRLLP